MGTEKTIIDNLAEFDFPGDRPSRNGIRLLPMAGSWIYVEDAGDLVIYHCEKCGVVSRRPNHAGHLAGECSRVEIWEIPLGDTENTTIQTHIYLTEKVQS